MSDRVPCAFRIFEEQCIALFPTLPASCTDPTLITSYMHVGQHGAASLDLLLLPAAPIEEMRKLRRELEAAPYRYRLRYEGR